VGGPTEEIRQPRQRTGNVSSRVSGQLRLIRPSDSYAGRRPHVPVLRLAEPRWLVRHAVGRAVDDGKLCSDHQARGRPRSVVGAVWVPRSQHGRAGGKVVRRRLPGMRRVARVARHRRTSGRVSRGDHVEHAQSRRRTS